MRSWPREPFPFVPASTLLSTAHKKSDKLWSSTYCKFKLCLSWENLNLMAFLNYKFSQMAKKRKKLRDQLELRYGSQRHTQANDFLLAWMEFKMKWVEQAAWVVFISRWQWCNYFSTNYDVIILVWIVTTWYITTVK